ncbi:MAG TPA: GAF domain-containing protein [Thermoanaerobaculia bacterium]|nr:GAF domain-containing protein [Thermoanaerobaculia bacterium]
MLAALGQRAIASGDFGRLLDEAVSRVTETLAVDYCAALELAPGGETLILRSAAGWGDGLPRRLPVGTGRDSMSAFVLLAGEPVVVEDFRSETRFHVAPLLGEHGVASGMGVVVRARRGPLGVLTAYTRRLRDFCGHDVSFLQSVGNLLALAFERDELERAERRKKELLQAIFDHIPVMISLNDRSGAFQLVNREWERTLGWTLEEARRIDVLAEIYPDPEVRRQVREFTQRAESRWADWRSRTRDGRVIETSWARITLSDGTRIGFGLDVTERKRLLHEVTASHARLEDLSRRHVRLQEEERRTMARELHDEVGQLLTGLKFMLETSARPGAAVDKEQLRQLAGQLLERVRDLALNLRPPMLDDLGLVPTLLWHIENYRAQTGIDVRFRHRGSLARLPAETEITAFRMVQEALTNIARHAEVREAAVELWIDDGWLRLRVEDGGHGFDQAAVRSAASGLVGMRERVRLLGGSLQIESRADAGTRLLAELPLAANLAPDDGE